MENIWKIFLRREDVNSGPRLGRGVNSHNSRLGEKGNGEAFGGELGCQTKTSCLKSAVERGKLGRGKGIDNETNKHRGDRIEWG